MTTPRSANTFVAAEPVSSTKVTLRDDLTPPIPIDVPMLPDPQRWVFDDSELPPRLYWFGEGLRCAETFPPGEENSDQCELEPGHYPDWPHFSQRSSV